MAALVLAIFAILWLGYLVMERLQIGRHGGAVPCRIVVTGTRGKTTVTRMLASVLREDGRTVLAKSTGSEAAYVLPDGVEQPIRRRGAPSIIEQKRLLRRAAKLGADTVVAEIMSIRPENHRVETHRILRPQLVLVTNFRVDHTEAQGASKEDVASVLALDVPPGVRALVPEAEWQPGFAARVEMDRGSVTPVPTGLADAAGGWGPVAANMDLVVAAGRLLGINDETIRDGVRKAREDRGAFSIWRYPLPDGRQPCLVVNAFAANDPESTLLLHDRVLGEIRPEAAACTGLLNLRADRGDRTLQWCETLAAGALDRFERLFVAGLHARALKHRLRRAPGSERVVVLKQASPVHVMERILEVEPKGPALLFGFGNIGGLGEKLIRHWRKAGESYGI